MHTSYYVSDSIPHALSHLFLITTSVGQPIVIFISHRWEMGLREANELTPISKTEEQLRLGFEPRWSDSRSIFLLVKIEKEKETRVKVSPRNVHWKFCLIQKGNHKRGSDFLWTKERKQQNQKQNSQCPQNKSHTNNSEETWPLL